MVVMTAKLSKTKRMALIIAVIAVIAVAIICLTSGKGNDSAAAPSTTASVSAADNDSRLAFLSSFGWTVSGEPVQTQQVRIPEQSSEVFDRYNALQISQGFDLSEYAGKTVTRYLYEIQNYEGASAPVYATLLVYQNQIIGGDIASSAPDGVMHGFAKPA